MSKCGLAYADRIAIQKKLSYTSVEYICDIQLFTNGFDLTRYLHHRQPEQHLLSSRLHPDRPRLEFSPLLRG
jgi:hypothetical protein